LSDSSVQDEPKPRDDDHRHRDPPPHRFRRRLIPVLEKEMGDQLQTKNSLFANLSVFRAGDRWVSSLHDVTS